MRVGAFILLFWLGTGAAHAANVVSDRSRLWPGRVIDVVVCDEAAASRFGHRVCRPPMNLFGIVDGKAALRDTEARTVRRAIARWNRQFGGNIRLEEQKEAPQGPHVVFRGSSSPGRCSTSDVGYSRTRRQTLVSIGADCTPRSSPRTREGTVLHEIMHAVGVYHEQQRYDRRRMIRFTMTPRSRRHRPADWAPLCDPAVFACDGEDRRARALGPYDFASIMHYALLRKPDGTLALTAAGKEHLADQALDPIEVGQRERFSFTDIRAVRTLYPDRTAAVGQIGPAAAFD